MSPGIYKAKRIPRFVIPSRPSLLRWKGSSIVEKEREREQGERERLPRRSRTYQRYLFFLTTGKHSSRVADMLKIGVTTFIMTLAMARPEPPVNSYLPPRTGTSGTAANGGRDDLFTRYGTPNFGTGVNRNAGATSFVGSAGGDAGGNGPSKLYDAPVFGGNGPPAGNDLGESRGNGFGAGRPAAGSYGGGNGGGRGRPASSAYEGGAFAKKNGGTSPPSSSTYGVPRASNNGNNGGRPPPPSTSYGVPGANGNGGGGGNGGGPPSTSYGVPHGADGHRRGGDFGDGGPPSSGYGAPGGNNFVDGNDNRGRHDGIGGNGAGPSRSENGGPGISGFGGGPPPSTVYGPPPNRAGSGNDNGYSAVGGNGGPANGGYPSPGGGPSGNAGNGGGFGHGGGGYNDNAQEESTEPAKYEFSYEVKDERSGSDYGHTETRDGDRAQGEFNVLLPDGRKQIVEYEADQDGFKPQIRYEGEANAGGYGSSGPNSNSGYSSDRPGSGGGSGGGGNFADNSRFNGGSSNGGYPNGGPGGRKPDGFNSGGGDGYQSGRPEGPSFGRDGDNGGLSGDIGGYFSNAPSNSIGDAFSGSSDSSGVGSNRQNGGNGGYRY